MAGSLVKTISIEEFSGLVAQGLAATQVRQRPEAYFRLIQSKKMLL
jgi:hypothetical protein